MNSSPRNVEHLKTGWLFMRGNLADAADPKTDDKSWQAVRVPHDWAIAGPFDRENDIQHTAILEDGETKKHTHTGRTGGLPHVGMAWYRHRLQLPHDISGMRFRLEFDGVMSNSQVFVNGKLAGSWPYGYASFAFDITRQVKPGENLVAVFVNNPPDASRWYPGAGIYRNVRLVTMQAMHLAHWGVRITTEALEEHCARVAIRTDIENHLQATDGATLESSILAPDGTVAATASAPLVGAPTQRVRQELTVAAPTLWALETPNLYTLRSVIRLADNVMDTSETRFGIRTLAFSARDGFLLNGRRVPLQGVCMHHDLGPLGAAMNKATLKRQLRILQDMGCNSLRTSHNPPAPELLDLADEMGILVIDEAFDEWQLGKVGNGYHKLFDEWAERDLRAMIRRDSNHPSVILWSLGNEIREQAEGNGKKTTKFLHDIARDEDPTRPTTIAMNQSDAAIENGLAEVVDVPGWNYKPEYYGAYREKLPNKPMYGSETASCISSRGVYYFPVEEERGLVRDTNQVNSYDLSAAAWANCPDVEFLGLDATPSIMGEFVWTGFDYLGEPTPYGEKWPSRSSYFGIVDLCGLPKDRFFLYRSRWSKRPTLHLLPHWTWPGREGQVTPVHCYSSWESVELFLNGKSMGRRTKNTKNLSERYRMIWAGVKYEPGELKAVAYDAEDRPADEYIVKTAGAPAAVKLEPEQDALVADGEDMAFVAFHICDAGGTRCPTADNLVTFRVSGPAELVALDNGNAASLELFTAPSHRVFNGSGMAFVRSLPGEEGDIVIEATSEGIAPASVTIRAHKAD